MNRVLVIVEGQTERAVIEQFLAPRFGERCVSLHAKIVGKTGHKGGIRHFASVRKEVLALMKQEHGSFVSTFFDYYGLPTDWPGLKHAAGKSASEKARIVETAMLEEMRSALSESHDSSRFLPYVQMHELEALLFSSPELMASTFQQPNLTSSFAKIVRQCGSCEEINDRLETSPSRRIAGLFPAYRKGSSALAHAPIIANRIGLDAIRKACPHFNTWITSIGTAGGKRLKEGATPHPTKQGPARL